MTNQETITKLNEALNTLIKAYEELQNENTLLEEKIDNLNKDKKELEAKVGGLEDKNRNLEDNVNELNDSTEKQNNNINSMLGKIENLLGSKKNSNKYEKDNNKFDSREKETFIKEQDNSKNSSLDQILEEEIDNTSANFKESSNSENKIDLNRMDFFTKWF